MINGHSRGRYLDDEVCWPILAGAHALGVPLYLHPSPPPPAAITRVDAGNYPAEVTGLLATAAWGWHLDTATQVLRLVLSGAFDRFPGCSWSSGTWARGWRSCCPGWSWGCPGR